MGVSVTRTGDWARMQHVLRGVATKSGGIIDDSIRAEAELAAAKVRENIDSGGALGGERWPELSTTTLAISPSARPLLGKHGEMRDAVKAHKLRKGIFMVGIARGTLSRSGVDLSLVGAVHESGAQLTVSWTPKRLRMFWGLVGKFLDRRDKPYRRPRKGTSGTKTTVVRIPPRPFLRPMLARMRTPTYGLKGRVQQYFMRRIASVR